MLGLLCNDTLVVRSRCRGDLDAHRIVEAACYVSLTLYVHAGDMFSMRASDAGPYWRGPTNSFFTGALVVTDD